MWERRSATLASESWPRRISLRRLTKRASACLKTSVSTTLRCTTRAHVADSKRKRALAPPLLTGGSWKKSPQLGGV